MICKNCGCGFKEGLERCPVCGTMVTPINIGPAMRGDGQQQFNQNSLQYNPQGMNQNTLPPNPPTPQKGNGKKAALIISGLAGVLLLLIVGIVLLPKWIGGGETTESTTESTEDTGRTNDAAGTESTGKKSSTESAVGSVAEDEFQELMKEVNELYNKKDYYNCWVKATVSMSNLPLTDVQNENLQKIVDACKAEAGDYYLKKAEESISNGKDTEFDTCTKYLAEMYAGDKEITAKVNKLKELKATNDEHDRYKDILDLIYFIGYTDNNADRQLYEMLDPELKKYDLSANCAQQLNNLTYEFRDVTNDGNAELIVHRDGDPIWGLFSENKGNYLTFYINAAPSVGVREIREGVFDFYDDGGGESIVHFDSDGNQHEYSSKSDYEKIPEPDSNTIPLAEYNPSVDYYSVAQKRLEKEKEADKERYVVLDFSYHLQSYGEYGDYFLSRPIHYCKGNKFDYDANNSPELKLDSKGKVKVVLEPGEWVFSSWQYGDNGPYGEWKVKVVEDQLRNHEEIKMWLTIFEYEDGVGNNIFYKNDDSLRLWSDGYAEGMVIGTDGKTHSYTVRFEIIDLLKDEDGIGMEGCRCTDVISDGGASVPFKAGENYYFDLFLPNKECYDEKKDLHYNAVIEIKDKNMEKTGYDSKYFSSQF